MKFKIVIMALLLMSVGIGSAVNRLPPSEFTGNISYVDSGDSSQEFDFDTEPTDGDVFGSVSNVWGLISAKYIDHEIIVGPSSDTWSIFYDYKMDGTADEVQVMEALTDHGSGATIKIYGTVYLSNTSSIYPTALYQTIRGESWMTTRLLRADGDTGHNLIINQSYFTIQDITISAAGNVSAATSDTNQCGIYWTSGQFVTIDHVWMGGLRGSGIYIEDSIGSLMGSVIKNSYISSVLKHCAYLGYSNGDLRVINNEFGESGSHCVYAHIGGSIFTGNHFWTASSGIGPASSLVKLTGSGNIFIGTFMDSPYYSGFDIYGDFNTITANRFWNPLYTGCIYVALNNGAANNTIVANTFHDSNGKVTNGVDVKAGADYNTVVANTFSGCTISDSGVGTDAAHNPGS